MAHRSVGNDKDVTLRTQPADWKVSRSFTLFVNLSLKKLLRMLSNLNSVTL